MSRQKAKNWHDLEGRLGASVDEIAPLLGVSRGKLFGMCHRSEIACEIWDGRTVILVQPLLERFGVKAGPKA